MHPPFQWSVTTDGVLLQKGNRHYSALKPVTLHWIDGHHKRQTLFKNYDNYRSDQGITVAACRITLSSGTVRASFSVFNTAREVRALAQSLIS